MHVGYVLLNCDLGSEEYVAEEIRNIPQVEEARMTLGAYDIVTKIKASSREEFDRTISEKMRSLSRVVSTMTLSVTDRIE